MAPATAPAPAPAPSDQCKRCRNEPATLQIRSEAVCRTCFAQYATTKAVKRMESYRGRRSGTKFPKKYLLSLSFGPSSTALLYMLDKQAQIKQERMGRADYELCVLHINTDRVLSSSGDAAERLERYRRQFPAHQHAMISLDDAFLLHSIDWASLGLPPPEDSATPTEKLETLLSSVSSVTSMADIISTLKTQLLVAEAKRHDCEGILFGDSTTRLAEKTLVQTAKGRGFSLPWQISDGPSPWDVNFCYPLRDLLKKEVATFTSLVEPSLEDLIVREQRDNIIAPSAKSTTIDALMAQYFDSVEDNYPSIVANVVRTSSKLQPPHGAAAQRCGLCGLPVTPGTDGIHGWGGDQQSHPTRDDANILCYGCSRSLHE